MPEGAQNMSTYGTESLEGIKYVVVGAQVKCDQGTRTAYLKSIYQLTPIGEEHVILEDERYFGNFSNDFGTCNSCYGRSNEATKNAYLPTLWTASTG